MNGKVKSGFSSHEDFLLTVTEALLKEQAMQYFGMEDMDSPPTRNFLTSPESANTEEVLKMLEGMVEYFGYGSFSINSKAPPPKEAVIFQENTSKMVPLHFVLPSGQRATLSAVVKSELPVDEFYNYCVNVCHWGLHVMQLNDTAKEGDLARSVINLKHCIPFFFSHSRLSKYFVECIDFLIKVCHTLSPKQRVRTLEGSFVNAFGGKGCNVEADLRQEHSVRSSKDLIKNLGANKTETAITRVTSAADSVAALVEYIDYTMGKPMPFSHHKKSTPAAEAAKASEILRELEPFKFTPTRECGGFSKMSHNPFDKIDRTDMKYMISQTINRLFSGNYHDESELDHGSDDENENAV